MSQHGFTYRIQRVQYTLCNSGRLGFTRMQAGTNYSSYLAIFNARFAVILKHTCNHTCNILSIPVFFEALAHNLKCSQTLITFSQG